MRSVRGVFVVGMDLKVGHGGEVAGFRHHIAAVAHEVICETVKGGVVRFPPCFAGGCNCMKGVEGGNVLLLAWVTNMFYCVYDDTGSRSRFSSKLKVPAFLHS